VLCIFCDERGPRSVEDINPRWMVTELGGVGPIRTDHFTHVPGMPVAKRTSTHGSMATLKVPNVCVTCNGGWMSVLEDATKPILLPLVRGQSQSLTIDACRQLAAWGQLKCITLDAYYRDPHLPASIAHHFCKRQQPMPNCLVIIGRYAPPGAGVALPFGRKKLEPPKVGRGSAVFVRTSFAFRHFYISVMLGGPSAVPTRFVFHSYDDRLAQSWPRDVNDDLNWPPATLITPEDFRVLA
jgi:hypothetical protein